MSSITVSNVAGGPNLIFVVNVDNAENFDENDEEETDDLNEGNDDVEDTKDGNDDREIVENFPEVAFVLMDGADDFLTDALNEKKYYIEIRNNRTKISAYW